MSGCEPWLKRFTAGYLAARTECCAPARNDGATGCTGAGGSDVLTRVCDRALQDDLESFTANSHSHKRSCGTSGHGDRASSLELGAKIRTWKPHQTGQLPAATGLWFGSTLPCCMEYRPPNWNAADPRRWAPLNAWSNLRSTLSVNVPAEQKWSGSTALGLSPSALNRSRPTDRGHALISALGRCCCTFRSRSPNAGAKSWLYHSDCAMAMNPVCVRRPHGMGA